MEKLCNPEDVPKVMSLQLLSEMTNNFSEDLKLGSGTYGKVYKGVHNGAEIAIKMLHLTPGSDDLEQFKKEFENLTRLKHENIVQLLGYSYEIKLEYVDLGGGRTVFAQNIYRALCFEYMHNGSLHEYLSDASRGLDWQARYKIIKGICNGLKYLHEGLENPMYHLDLKPDNILLDKNMVPKLADFGLSKLVRNDQTQATQSSIGTLGYLPPEYIEQNLVSNKFDIFSLGVVMIRIMTGYDGYHKKADLSSQEFIDLVQESWRERLQATSGCISMEDECHQVKRCIEIALDCVKADRKQRPEIGRIMHWLSEIDYINEKLGIGSPHKTRPHVASHIEKASSFVSDLVDEVSSMDVAAARSTTQQISSVPDRPVETRIEVSSYVLDLLDEVFSMDVAAAPSLAQQISSVPDRPVETSTKECSSVSAEPSPLQRITGVIQEPGGTSRKILSDQSSEISKLLDVHPLELRFPWEPNQDIECPLTLTNRTDCRVGVWITPICEDKISNIYFIVSDFGDSSPILQATIEPYSTFAIALKLKGQPERPPDAMFEVLMVVTGKEWNVSSTGSKLNMDSEFLKGVEKLGGEVRGATLRAVICDPTSCQRVFQHQQFIPAPSDFRYIEGIDLHPTETWILARHDGCDVYILNYQTHEKEMVVRVTKRIPTWKHILPSTFTHSSPPCKISSAKFIAQEQWFACGDLSGWVHVYSYITKDKVMEFEAHQQYGKAQPYKVVLAVHPASPYLLTSLFPGEIKLWDWSKGWECTRKLETGSLTSYVTWNPMDSKTFISVAGQVMVWDIHSSDPVTRLKGSDVATSCCLYSDGHQNFMFTHESYNHCGVWNMETKKHVHELFLRGYRATEIACHPTLPILVTVSCKRKTVFVSTRNAGTICVWDARTYRLVKMVPSVLWIGGMILTGTKDSPRLIVGLKKGISVMEINLPTLDMTDLHTDRRN